MPLVDGAEGLLAVLVAVVAGVVGTPPNADFRLGVAFRLAKLVSPRSQGSLVASTCVGIA